MLGIVLGIVMLASVTGCDALTSPGDDVDVRWTYSTSSLYPTAHPAGEITAIADGEKLVGVDTDTGEERWRFDRGVRDVTVDGDRIVAGGCCQDDADGAPTSLFALDAQDGSVLWTVERPNAERAIPKTFEQVAIDGDTAFVSSNGDEVFAVDMRTGAERWSQETQVFGRPVVSGSTVAVGGDGSALGFDTKTGDIRWTLPLDPALTVAGATVFDGTIVFSASTEFASESDVTARIVAVDPVSGRVKWSYVSDATESTAPVVVGDHVVVGLDAPLDGADRGVLAFDGADKPLWRSEFRGPVTTLRGGEDAAAIFVYAEITKSVHSIDPRSGATRWTLTFDEFGGQFLEPGASLVWAVGDGDQVAGLDPETGEVLASYTALGSVTSLTMAEQSVFVGTYGEGLVALNP